MRNSTMRSSILSLTLGFALVFFVIPCSTSSAGILALHPDATQDTLGFPATGTFSGNASVGPATLDVQVDYAVFEAPDFVSNFPASGYTPTGPLVYTYQVHVNAPPSNIPVNTQLVLPVIDYTDAAPSWFNTPALGGQQAPGSALWGGLNSDVARWEFPDLSNFSLPNYSIDPGESSYGLVFSSNNVPEFEFFGGRAESITISGGALTAILPVHVPSTTPWSAPIPEPTTLTLLGLAMVTGAGLRRRS